MYVILAEFTLKPESTHDFLLRVKKQAQDSLALEPDCHVFDVCVHTENENFIVLYEVYTDKNAFDRHLESAHFDDFRTDVAPWVSDKKVSSFKRK
jgi:autoinducer 2-degrading protein